MHSFREEARIGASVAGWWIFIIVLIFAASGAGWWFFNRPHIDRGYAYQVNGLVTAYCTASMKMDKEAARGDIIAEKNSAPKRWERMTEASRARADQVINRDEGVCQ